MSASVAEQSLALEAQNSQWWCEHFRENEDRQSVIPWDDAHPLGEVERRILLPSLQDFQLGESSEGRHGRARAAAYGERVADAHYAEAIRLFFAEENRHAAYLARYLRLHGVEPIGRSWTDFVFRRVRRLMGLELLLIVLLTAELIGEVYYRAIRAATACPTLRAICAQLLRDERMHVRFHVERFRFLRRGRWRLRTAIQDAAWACFFGATCLAVWAKHRRAFRLGGHGFRRFWRDASHRRRRAVRESNRSVAEGYSVICGPGAGRPGPRLVRASLVALGGPALVTAVLLALPGGVPGAPGDDKPTPKDLGDIRPPGGAPLPLGERGTEIRVDYLKKVVKRLEAAPAEDLDKWVTELERIVGKKLEGLSVQGCRTYFVTRLGLAFNDLEWNPKAANKLFQRAQSLPPSEAKAWKDTFEAVLKKEIGQTDKEVLDGGPAYGIPLVLIPVDALHDGQKYSAERGKKYRARLRQLTAEDVGLWIREVDRFGGTRLDAAINIALLDDYFDKERFRRDRFQAAIEGRKKQGPAAGEQGVGGSYNVSPRPFPESPIEGLTP